MPTCASTHRPATFQRSCLDPTSATMALSTKFRRARAGSKSFAHLRHCTQQRKQRLALGKGWLKEMLRCYEKEWRGCYATLCQHT